MNQQVKDNLNSGDNWKRGLFILLFALCYAAAEVVMWVVVVLQFLFLIISGEDNERLRRLGASLAIYIADVIRYITLNSDDRPFPYSPWPDDEPLEGEVERETPRAEETPSSSASSASAAAAGVVAGAAAAEVLDDDPSVVEGELMDGMEEADSDADAPSADDVVVLDDDRPDAGETESGV